MTKFQTPPGILSYPGFYVPRPRAKDQDPVYSGMLMFTAADLKTPYFKILRQAVEECAKEGNPKKVLGKSLRSPFRSADERDNLPEEIEVFINPWSKRKPQVIDARKEEILDSDDVWAGQWARFTVTPFFYEVPGNTGVSLALDAVQILKSKGMKRLDGRKTAAEMFDDEYSDLEDEEF